MTHFSRRRICLSLFMIPPGLFMELMVLGGMGGAEPNPAPLIVGAAARLRVTA